MTTVGISNSEMATWSRCRRMWYLRYYLELDTPPGNRSPAGLMHLGSRIHTALELYYGRSINPRTVLDVIYRVETRDHPEYEEELKKEYDLAIIMIDGYLDWVEETGADEDLEVIGTERIIRVPSGVAGIDLMGRIDVRVRRLSDGARLFVDHKTLGGFDRDDVTIQLDPQMRFYTLLDQLESVGDATAGNPRPRTDGGLYNMLRRVKRGPTAKPPFYRRDTIKYNTDTLRSTWIRAVAIVTEIANARKRLDDKADHRYETYPTATRDCSKYCQFAQVCPMMDDGSRYLEMLETQYVKTEPYGYYDGYNHIPELHDLIRTSPDN